MDEKLEQLYNAIEAEIAKEDANMLKAKELVNDISERITQLKDFNRKLHSIQNSL